MEKQGEEEGVEDCEVVELEDWAGRVFEVWELVYGLL